MGVPFMRDLGVPIMRGVFAFLAESRDSSRGTVYAGTNPAIHAILGTIVAIQFESEKIDD